MAPNPTRLKIPLSAITTVVFTFAVVVVILFGESISSVTSGAIFGLKKSCARRISISGVVDEADRVGFDPDECSLVHGKWVFDRSIKPLYSDRTCPYLDRQVSCVKNGRPDSDYRHWQWQPDECALPEFDAPAVLQKLRGKRLMFVGDSLQREQWQSFVCLVEHVIPEKQKSMQRGRMHSVFKAKKFDATIEFYWAPFLIESNSDEKIVMDPTKRIMRVDSIENHAKNWKGVDIFVFNTYVWWMSGLKTKSLWGSFANGEQGYEELETRVAYRIGLKTWANWVDSNVDPDRTRVFFTTLSPIHHRSADWGNVNGTKCYKETKPVEKRGHWGSGSNKEIMSVVADVVRKMKVPVTLINITQLSEYRIDAHTSIYTELGGKLLTDEQKEDPLHYADCVHWCLPGVPDTWNRILFAYLML
ncbi:protein trichome birefringence-like 3 [Andrographis paniculata]|uniref:protein trichome birefringence-like 3 n=1 Tax=Andrographis paniculata TaxID=175694 RepID=UPI0021E86955|nr:protein trichome birefringence-like 3 [Andrographis paniculata]